MKKINFSPLALFFFITIILIFSIFLIKLEKNDQFKNYQKIYYRLNGKRYYFLVADTDEKRIKGLMNVRELKNYDGMIFIFSKKDFRSFWNKNTYLDLDLYWIADDKVVGKNFLPSIKKSKNLVIITSPEKVNKVIELAIR